jgi:hypothetical protein
VLASAAFASTIVDDLARSAREGRVTSELARQRAVIDGTTALEAAFEASACAPPAMTASVRRQDAGDASSLPTSTL